MSALSKLLPQSFRILTPQTRQVEVYSPNRTKRHHGMDVSWPSLTWLGISDHLRNTCVDRSGETCSLSCQIAMNIVRQLAAKSTKWVKVSQSTGMFGNVTVSCCHRNDEEMKQSHYPNIILEDLILNRSLDAFLPTWWPLILQIWSPHWLCRHTILNKKNRTEVQGES